jgi:signal transduction histidine kinase
MAHRALENGRKRQVPFAWVAAGWVAAAAALAAAGLVGLHRWHGRAARRVAAQSVAEKGQWLAFALAGRAGEAAAGRGGGWGAFAGWVESLRGTEPDLAYVAVRQGGDTLFQEAGGEVAPAIRFAGPVRMGRRLLEDGGGQEEPVVTFAVALEPEPGAEPVELEAGIARRAVEREEWTAMRAIDSMYRLGLATVAAAFALCLALVAWVARREEARERARRREEHLAFSGMLANGIVHDFRNPMSSLRLDAQMLEKEASKGGEARPARVMELAGRMRHTLDRMDRIFREFLTLARPDDGAVPERADLAVCARECAEMMAPRYEAAGMRLETDALAPAPFAGPSAGAKRAILNLLLNALQHGQVPGPVRLSVEVSADRVALEVEDNGPGIPRADREKVFGMFYTTRPQGTGLGLFMARLAVEHAGGRLAAIEPHPGRGGARLRMEYPRATAQPEEKESP